MTKPRFCFIRSTPRIKKARWMLLWATLMAFCDMSATRAWAAPRNNERVVDVPLGGSATIRVPGGLERIVVGDPQICDVVPMPGGQLLLTAKLAGETQITVLTRDGTAVTYHITASVPVAALQQAFREAFPDEPDIQIRSLSGAVYLSGTASDATVVEAASRMATSYFVTSGRKVAEIVNLIQIAKSQQVQVHLRFVEISRSDLRSMGFNMWANNNSSAGALFGPNQPYHYCITCDTQRFDGPASPAISEGATAVPVTNANPYLPIILTPITGTFGLSFATNRILPLSATLALLEQRGVAKTLSEPTLVAASGHEAKFLVGGEFPIPVPDALGHILIQFKNYGAQLAFTPVVVGQETVNLKIDSTMSDIDNSHAIVLASASVPALKSRQSSTTVRIHDGQSFAIAGLLSEKIQSTVSKVPGLGELPIIGLFFRSVQHERDETELMVLATVNLVRPMEAGDVPPIMNQDEFTDPGDLELFLMGNTEKTKNEPQKRSVNNPEANAGEEHAMNGPDGMVGFSR